MLIVSFDCYGTIIDWERGIVNTIRKVFPNSHLSYAQILNMYAEIESKLEKHYRPYREILRDVMIEFANSLNREISSEEELALVKSLPKWPAFDDSRNALRRIKNLAKIAIISNVDNDLIAKTIENLGVKFDFVITAEMVGAYKPSLSVFKYAQRVFNVTRNEWLHAAQSVYHDIAPCRKLGIKTALIKRRGHGATPKAKGDGDLSFNDLSELADFLERLK
ncbi:haloacid dehalogenase superfamily enzyme, subfamily IA [Aciduliprofundum sp. MAR08-339]|uniref:HAD-IA family hydrolase n=1 Tax=Aciduliprofundum sp. (strain MAR08-339) TaxID=673860 RepID=UPI0002A49A5E|nr:haloacid dehalogenase superfamily enzyme, subfamily IA [Aciduliprofundum sp. MAR08-339]